MLDVSEENISTHRQNECLIRSGDQLYIENLLPVEQETWDQFGRQISEQHVERFVALLNLLHSWGLSGNFARAAFSHYLSRYEAIAYNEQQALFDAEVFHLAKAFGEVLGNTNAEPKIQRLQQLFILARERPEVAIFCLADHVVKMRLLNESGGLEPRSVAAEAEAVYIPIARLFGIWEFQTELGERSLKILYPETLAKIQQQQAAAAADQETLFKGISSRLDKEMRAARVEGGCELHRESAFGLYRRSQQEDHIARLLRAIKIDVIVATEEECNQVSRLIDRRLISGGQWTSKRRHFRDRISEPKFNGYRVLTRKLTYHPTADHSASVPVEFRIRTREMEEVNRRGIIAAGVLSGTRTLIKNAWWDDEKNIEIVREHSAGRPTDGIYVFSPLGQVHSGFPLGSTPIDYAYRIHTDVGHNCKRVLVNGQEAAPDAALRNGDVVEIVVDPSFRGPQEGWLAFVKTPEARNYIARAIAEREVLTFSAAYRKGRRAFDRLLDKEMSLYGLEPFPEEVAERFLEKTARYEYHYSSVKAMFVDIADPDRSSRSQPISLNRVVSRLITSQLAPHIVSTNGGAVGIAEHSIRFAECTHKGKPCRVVPGSKIVGRITRAGTQFQGLTVYRQNCENAPSGESAIELEWRGEGRTEEAVKVTVEAIDDSKLLLTVLNCVYDLYDKGVYLHQLEAKVAEDLFAHIVMKITRRPESIRAESADGDGLLRRLEDSLKQLLEKGLISTYYVEPLSPVEKVLLARRDRLPNPYTQQPLRDARLFKGREAERDKTVNNLSDGRNPVIVYGAPRVGKTSFLRYLKDHGLPKRTFVAVLVEHSDFCEYDFWQRISVEINKAMNDLNQGRPAAIPYDRTLLQEMKAAPFNAFQRGLEKVRERLGGKKLIVIIDEFTALDTDWPEPEARRVVSQLKTLVENCDYLEFVLSVHDELFRAAAEQKINSLPLLAEGIPVFLNDCLDRESAERLILEPLSGMVVYERAAVEEILDLTAGQPYYIHSVLYEVITLISREDQLRVTPSHVSRAVENNLKDGDALFLHLNKRLNDAERSTVRAVFNLSGVNQRRVSLAEIREYLNGRTRARGDLGQELSRLSEKGILNRKREERAITYEVRIPLFGRWLTRDILSLASET